MKFCFSITSRSRKKKNLISTYTIRPSENKRKIALVRRQFCAMQENIAPVKKFYTCFSCNTRLYRLASGVLHCRLLNCSSAGAVATLTKRLSSIRQPAEISLSLPLRNIDSAYPTTQLVCIHIGVPMYMYKQAAYCTASRLYSFLIARAAVGMRFKF